MKFISAFGYVYVCNQQQQSIGVLCPVHIIEVPISSVWCTDSHVGSVQFSSRHFIETKNMILDKKNTTLQLFHITLSFVPASNNGIEVRVDYRKMAV